IAAWTLAGLALVGMFATVRLVQSRRDLNRARIHLVAARKAVTAKQTDSARRSLDAGEKALKSAEHRSTAFPMSIIDAVPFLGSPGRAAKDTARAGYRVVSAGQLLADAAADFPTTSGKTGVEGHDLSNIHA